MRTQVAPAKSAQSVLAPSDGQSDWKSLRPMLLTHWAVTFAVGAGFVLLLTWWLTTTDYPQLESGWVIPLVVGKLCLHINKLCFDYGRNTPVIILRNGGICAAIVGAYALVFHYFTMNEWAATIALVFCAVFGTLFLLAAGSMFLSNLILRRVDARE